MVPAGEMVWVPQQYHASMICTQSPSLAQLGVSHHHTHYRADEAHSVHVVGMWEQEGLQVVQQASACMVQEA